MSAPEIVARKQWLLLDAAGEADDAVVGIPRATLLRWACEEIAAMNIGRWVPLRYAPPRVPRLGMFRSELAAAALLLCEAIGTDEADSLEVWG